MTVLRETESHLEVFTDNKEVKHKIDDLLSAYEPGHEMTPRYQSGRWDGKKRFYETKLVKTGGLFFIIEKGFLQRLLDNITFDEIELDEIIEVDYMEYLKRVLPELPFKPYKHQLKAFVQMVNNKRYFASMCTSSGKSLVAYLTLRYFWEHHKKSVLIVPVVSLTEQMFNDFKEYNAPDDFLNDIKLIGGDNIDKNLTHNIIIGTYQSLIKVTHQMDSYDIILNDETHLASSDSLQKILQMPFSIKLGMTGSVPIIEVDLLSIIQIFGEPDFIIRARELMDMGLLTDSYIVPMFLNYPKTANKLGMKSGMKYQDEVKFIKENPLRIEFNRKFLGALKGLTVALYAHTEQGERTYESLTGEKPKYNDFERMKELGVFFVSGKTRSKIREQIRQYTNNIHQGIIIANYKVFSTGINLPNINNIVFLSSTKSFVTVLQSLGRVFRLKQGKTKAMIYDLIDVFPYKKDNYSLNHFWQREGYYHQERHKIIEKEIHL